MSLQVGYLGEQGQHIEDYGNLNQYRVMAIHLGSLITTTPTGHQRYRSLGEHQIDSVADYRVACPMNYQGAADGAARTVEPWARVHRWTYTYGKALTNSLGNYALNVSGFSELSRITTTARPIGARLVMT